MAQKTLKFSDLMHKINKYTKKHSDLKHII